MALPPELRNHYVTDVPAHAEETFVQRVPNRHTSDDPPCLERKQEGRRNVIRREILASLLLSEHLEVATEGHPLLVMVKERWDLWRRRAVSTQEILLFVLSR